MKITLEYDSDDPNFGIGIYENSRLISHSWIDKNIDEYKVFNIALHLFSKMERNK